MSGTLLFSPTTIRGVTLKNRIVVPPAHRYSADKGFPTDWHLMNAGKFAVGGAGLVVVEFTKVERRGCGTVGDLGIWDDRFIAPLGRLVSFIRQQNPRPASNSAIRPQGACDAALEGDKPLERTPEIEDWDEWTPVAPSAIAHSERWPVPRALERGEVKDLVQARGEAPRRADAAGFDVLELHGAHGYLVHEFLSERANQRADEYGGSEQNRMRFLIEITEAVRTYWPEHKPLFVRLSVEDNAGFGPEQSVRLAKILKAKGVDVIDCSSGGITEMAPILGKEIKFGYQVPLSDYVWRARRHHDHGGRPDHPRRPGRADLARQPGRPDRDRARNPQQPELADGRRAETRRGGPVPQRAAAVRLLAGHAREAGIRDAAVDVAERAGGGEGDVTEPTRCRRKNDQKNDERKRQPQPEVPMIRGIALHHMQCYAFRDALRLV